MTDACDRPGCTGSYDADGYCDECGRKRSLTASSSAPAAPAPVSRSVSLGITRPTSAGLGGPSGLSVTGTRSRTGGRGRLGANLVAVPPVPLRDPTTAVMSDPQVPESHRFCSTCGEPVGRSRKGKPGRAEGFCPKDRTPFSYVPRLSPGDLVDHRYEILGALAHGGLGWIYLARDRNISDSGADRWVVLKGLINTGDADAMAAAMAERRFLVEVDHPLIVKIHDFAQHPDPKTGEMIGYIVMEYVGGRSLKDLALAHTGPNGQRAPLPLDQVLAYVIEILPAIGYLHDRGLLFCDFKPDNVIHAEEQLKLIDLGAVRRIDDQASPLWGTPGYQAPELEKRGASIASDIYTVGRTLAVLSFDFGGFSTRFSASLPDPRDVDLLAREESFHRLLLRSTDVVPEKRFDSAGQFAEQALGVLREVLATADGIPRPAPSTEFTPERRVFGATAAVASGAAVGVGVAGVGTARVGTAGVGTAGGAVGGIDGASVVAALPLPLVDPTDPAAGFLATLGGDHQQTLTALETAPVRSVEVGLRLVRAHLDAGDAAGAAIALTAVAPAPSTSDTKKRAAVATATGDRAAPGDWRIDWYTGLVALAAGRSTDAVVAFEAVYSALPGEPAARLALAAACELAGDRIGAITRYLRVWRVDHGFVSAAFGLARTLLADGDRAAAVSILDEVPEISSQYQAAQVAAVLATLDADAGPIDRPDLLSAAQRLERLRLEQSRRAGLVVEVLRRALRWLRATPPPSGSALATTPSLAASTDALLPRVPWPQVIRDRFRPAAAPDTPAATVPPFLGGSLQERDIRLGLERAYRLLASLEPDQTRRYSLVDQANAVRPQTVV
jgi:serine/threonine-protein kinase PknG